MNIETVTPLGLMALKDKIDDVLLVVVSDGTYLWELDKNYDITQAKNLGYRPLKLVEGKNYGPILVEKGDIGIYYKGEHLPSSLRTDFVDWLISNGINATIDRNDILVDGKKISGEVSVKSPDGDWWAMSISMSINLINIASICPKKMVKIPVGLNEYGLTTDMIVRWLYDSV